MIVLWITLFFLPQGYTLVPVKTVLTGENAKLTCTLSTDKISAREIHWYKQSVGDTLKLMGTLLKYEEQRPDFSETRFKVHHDDKFCNLTILRATEEDEGMYHCLIKEWIKTKWSGTYLLIKGNQKTSNFSLQWPATPDPLLSGDPVTLQCSIQSDIDKTCPEGHGVFWFRVESNTSHPNILYSVGHRPNDCKKTSDSQKRCFYHLSKNISSSDDGTYYCAVATCGEILFGEGTKLEPDLSLIPLIILIVCLAISVIGNGVLIYYRRVCEYCKGNTSFEQSSTPRHPVHDGNEAEDDLNYAALNFSERRPKKGKKREFTENMVSSLVVSHEVHFGSNNDG
ncbi:uncharacterized protein KZ484_009995 [Pholidichthys leucotaenia]